MTASAFPVCSEYALKNQAIVTLKNVKTARLIKLSLRFFIIYQQVIPIY